MSTRFFAVAFITSLCGAQSASAAQGTGKLLGPVFDHGFVVRDAVYAYGPASTQPGQSMSVILSDHAGLCRDLENRVTRRDTQYLNLELMILSDSGSGGVGTGIYNVVSDEDLGRGGYEGRIATVSYQQNTDDCPSVASGGSRSGFVEVRGDSFAEGEFNVQMHPYELPVAGWYHAQECPALSELLANTSHIVPECKDRR